MKRQRDSERKVNSFILKTYDMLNENKFEGIMSWTEDGKAFQISDVPAFTELILPTCFKHKNFSSFVRQLNMYDFHKQRDSGEIHIFSHPHFRRGKRDQLRHIHRKTSELYPMSIPKKYSQTIDYFGKISEIQEDYSQLKETLNGLKKQQTEILMMNQALVSQLYQSRDKEMRLEQCLSMILNNTSNVLPVQFPIFGSGGLETSDRNKTNFGNLQADVNHVLPKVEEFQNVDQNLPKIQNRQNEEVG